MSHRILLCDDEIHILRAAEFKLRNAGFHIRLASDGELAWEAIQEERPDLLITDYQMPRLDGLGLIARIRQVPELTSLPIFLLTGKGFELVESELKKTYGIRALLSKPFSPRDILQRVQQVLLPAADNDTVATMS